MKAQKIDKDYIMLYMPHGGESGVIQAWYQGDHSWVEFRGPPYSQWLYKEPKSPFQMLHDSLLGMHCTVLHQDQILALIRDRHSDFNAIEQLMQSEKVLKFQRPADYVSL
jgi:hypothetical protein